MKAKKSEQEFKDFLNELDPTPASPGKTCRAFRNNFDLTLQDVAEVTGIQVTNLSAIENDKIEMSSYISFSSAIFLVFIALVIFTSTYLFLFRHLFQREQLLQEEPRPHLPSFLAVPSREKFHRLSDEV